MQPIAVLLCPGWEKAQIIYNLLEESKVSQTLHPIIVLVGIGKDEAKAVKFPKNCEQNRNEALSNHSVPDYILL